MPRKATVPKSDLTPALLKFREKRKWQIALRRYVLEQKPSPEYAPYFGLDITNLRQWFEIQFEPGVSWNDFAHKWQFDHIIPVTYFDFGDDQELKTCWNFTNLRAAISNGAKDPGHYLDIFAAKRYFEQLYQKTLYKPCLALLDKIDRLSALAIVHSEKQQDFITKHRPYLDILENYSSFEFELLNNGRTINEVIKETAFLKKF